jgi:hypothetical protein
MTRVTRVLALGAATVAAAFILVPATTTHRTAKLGSPVLAGSFRPTAAGNVDILAVNSKGTAKNESKDNNRTVYTFPMYDLATGAEIGTITDDVGPTPVPGVVDVITTYRFQNGSEIAGHMPVSISQDSQKPGWIVVGNRPEKDTIVKATGDYAGRTGRVRLSGVDDVRKFPGEIYQDDFWIIELNK